MLLGMEFTGKYFTGNVEVTKIKDNDLFVDLEKDGSNWTETWNLQHVVWGFDREDYFLEYTHKLKYDLMLHLDLNDAFWMFRDAVDYLEKKYGYENATISDYKDSIRVILVVHGREYKFEVKKPEND